MDYHYNGVTSLTQTSQRSFKDFTISLLTKACSLDPRLKLPAFMSQNEKDELISDIESELEEIEHSTMGTHQSVSPTTAVADLGGARGAVAPPPT